MGPPIAPYIEPTVNPECGPTIHHIDCSSCALEFLGDVVLFLSWLKSSSTHTEA